MKCYRCKNKIFANYTVADNLNFHTKCFSCAKCHSIIKKKYYKKNNEFYHLNCYNELFGFKCSICNSHIKGEYLVNFWKEKAHTLHEGVKIIECNGCAKFIKNNKVKLCSNCKTDIVDGESVIHELLKEILIEFCEIGVIINKKNIKVATVTSSYFGTNHEQQGEAMTSITSFGNIKNYKHSISIIENLNRLSYKGVLAHELLHTWLNEKEIKLHKYQVEGFCNLGSYLVYLNSTAKEGKLYINRLQNDNSEIYGDGFRFMIKLLNKLGWKELLNELLSINNGDNLEKKYKNINNTLNIDDIFIDIEKTIKINKPNIDDFNF